jgi:hypothetical protein
LKAAGVVLTTKQAPHRPGIAPALGLRAGMVAVAFVTQADSEKEIEPGKKWRDEMRPF